MTDPLRAMARRIALNWFEDQNLPVTPKHLEDRTERYLALARDLAGMPETLRAAREAQRGHVEMLGEEHA